MTLIYISYEGHQYYCCKYLETLNMFLGLCSSSALPEEMGNGHMCDISNQLNKLLFEKSVFYLIWIGLFLRNSIFITFQLTLKIWTELGFS